MSKQDPYEVLGVPRDASPDEIKSAYRRLARRYHPDVNPNDPSAEDKFKEIGEAYSILSDEEKRRRFDQFGSTDDIPVDPFFGQGGFADIFDMFFGTQSGGSRGGRRSRIRSNTNRRSTSCDGRRRVEGRSRPTPSTWRARRCSRCVASSRPT